MKPTEQIIVYTDGGSRGNPGPSAVGVVIQNTRGETIKEYGEIIPKGTNNEAEYAAVIFALKKLRQLFGKSKTKHMNVDMRMDSDLIASQLSGKFKIQNENLFKPFIDVWNLRMDFGAVSFRHVPREKNKRADQLLNMALDGSSQKTLL